MAEGKWITGISADARVADAARVVLSSRLDVVCRFLPLAAQKPNQDPEYVHQLRVGTRRSGAALRAFASALPRKLLKEMRNRLRSLRRAAADARDWDVFLAALPAAKPLTGETAQLALVFLTGYAYGARAAAQERLVAAANESGASLATFTSGLVERIREPERADSSASFGALAATQLGRLFKEFNAAIAANPTTPDALHALRIGGKRLRYAIEIFGECFPPAIRDVLYPTIERVQELLGVIQDAATGIHRLKLIRDSVHIAPPKQITSIQKGIDRWSASLRARIPVGRRAFATWRTEWEDLMRNVKLEVVAATLTAAR
jgi:CHAD domain-containing protein